MNLSKPTMGKVLASVFTVMASIPAPAGCADAKPDAGDNRATFPLIFFAVPDSDNAFANVKRWGGTHVHTYGSGLSVEKDRSFFDRAAQHGLKVMANLKGQNRLQDGVSLEDFESYVSSFAKHPALGIWYLYDEPATKHTAKEIEPFYKLLKEKTPGVSVAIGLNWTEKWDAFPSVLDIAMPDTYPVTGAPFPNASLHQVSNFTGDILEVYSNTIPILQMMNWKVFVKEGETELRRYPIDQLRYPNAIEMRYMCFSAIAMGAKGLSFYSYIRSMQDDPAWADKVLAPVLKEVRKFTDEIGGAALHRVRQAEDDETYVTVFDGQEGKWVMLVNAWPAARKVGRNIKKLIPAGTLTPWGETRKGNATFEDGALHVEVEPWEVLIWRVTP